jgi:DNA-binding GntR family transcriptional regulator
MSNAVDRAYDLIRSKILTGDLKPGERLREEELVVQTGVSRTPVREALRRLESDGYTQVQANRGATVSSYSKRDVDEIYGLRALLEGHAARRAATRVTAKQVAKLESINDKMRQLARFKGSEIDRQLGRSKLNHEFHEVILEASDNTRLSTMVRQLAQAALSARTFAQYGPEHEARALDNHDELIRALKSGYPDWAEATMRSHVHNARQIMTAVAETIVAGADAPDKKHD